MKTNRTDMTSGNAVKIKENLTVEKFLIEVKYDTRTHGSMISFVRSSFVLVHAEDVAEACDKAVAGVMLPDDQYKNQVKIYLSVSRRDFLVVQ